MLSPYRQRTEDGASSVEYGLIVFAIAALITIAVFALGRVVDETYADSCGKLQDKVQASTASC